MPCAQGHEIAAAVSGNKRERAREREPAQSSIASLVENHVPNRRSSRSSRPSYHQAGPRTGKMSPRPTFRKKVAHNAAMGLLLTKPHSRRVGGQSVGLFGQQLPRASRGVWLQISGLNTLQRETNLERNLLMLPTEHRFRASRNILHEYIAPRANLSFCSRTAALLPSSSPLAYLETGRKSVVVLIGMNHAGRGASVEY